VPGGHRRVRPPLARKPKQLEEAPSLYRSDGQGGLVLLGDDRARTRHAADTRPPGSASTEATPEQGRREAVADVLEAPQLDPAVTAMVQRIAHRLALRRRPPGRPTTRGSGRLMTVPYRYNSDDIDLDRTIDMLTERPVPEDTDILVRERMRARRAITLVGDVSGSMRGEKVRIVAATIAALAGDLADDELAVVAFWKHAALVKPIDRWRTAEAVLRDLLAIPARGLTNVAFGLETGRAELTRARSRTRVGILLSDAVHNAGPDPRDVAERFERLHVLLETDGEHDAALARQLAKAGGGQVVPIAHWRQIPEALNRLLAA
jgi:Mg-chelatase subunit ChlD